MSPSVKELEDREVSQHVPGQDSKPSALMDLGFSLHLGHPAWQVTLFPFSFVLNMSLHPFSGRDNVSASGIVDQLR